MKWIWIFALAACGNEVDAQWQLDHDRVIAVRSTPPRIASGETAALTGLVGQKGGPPVELDATTAEVVSPSALAGALTRQGTQWTVTAPPGDQLAAARAELGLAGDAPVPLQLQLTYTDHAFVAFKTVYLGVHADNPVIAPITINGGDGLATADLVVPAETNVPLAIDVPEIDNVNWLSSCGTMHDFDIARAYLRVEPDDPHAGDFALVVRDTQGGVFWHVWTIHTP
ncbi:MAG TPA: hypothetical protein VFP84_06755 [Kofleriaceae bacterium]|nr:hypothetical protein [Kofleriaceae bacterium]